MKKLLLTAALLAAAIGLMVLLAGCGKSSTTTANLTAQDGDTVSVNYIGTLQDGTQFDSSYTRGQPLTFVLGAGQMIAGFDAAVHGMTVGQTKTVTLDPSQAYGPHSTSLVITLDRSIFPASANLTVGAHQQLQNSSGQTATGVITSVNATSVTVDLNPPLAGKTLIFKITLESITPPTKGG